MKNRDQYQLFSKTGIRLLRDPGLPKRDPVGNSGGRGEGVTLLAASLEQFFTSLCKVVATHLKDVNTLHLCNLIQVEG